MSNSLQRCQQQVELGVAHRQAAPDITAQDIERLPDLGSTLNDLWVWRYYPKRGPAIAAAHPDDFGDDSIGRQGKRSDLEGSH